MPGTDAEINIGLKITSDPQSLDALERVEQRVAATKKTLTEGRLTLGGTSPELGNAIPGFDESMMRQISIVKSDLDSILSTRKQIEKTTSQQNKDTLIDQYNGQIESINKRIADLFDAKRFAQTFASGLTDGVETGLKGVIPTMRSALRTFTQELSKVQWGPQSDNDIVRLYMQSAGYKRMIAPLQQTGNRAYDDYNMENLIKALLPSSVPQFYRSKVSQDAFHKSAIKPEMLRDLLPTNFRGMAIKPSEISRKRNYEDDDMRASFELTKYERQQLFKLLNNPHYGGFAADAAEKAGIIFRHNGSMYFNPRTTHHMLNSMGGYVMQDFEIGARGEEKYGIKDVEDPKKFDNIARKTNRYMIGALRIMEGLQEVDPNIVPDYYSDDVRYSGIVKSDGSLNPGILVGKIAHSPRAESRAFAEYTADLLQQGVKITGHTPVTGTAGENAKPEDYHTITKRRSMLQDILERTNAGYKPKHNEFSENAIYYKLDQALQDPSLTNEDREKYIKQYTELFQNGIVGANGKHYSYTRFNDTHAEFILDDILEELGRDNARELVKDLTDEGFAKLQTQDFIKLGKQLLFNEGQAEPYTSVSKFAKSLYNRSTLDTEGQNLLEFMGLRGQNGFGVAVSDFKALEDLFPGFSFDTNGANLIDARLVPQGGQGRGIGNKGTFVPVDFMAMRKTYHQFLRENDQARRRIEEVAKIKESKGLAFTEQDRWNILERYGDFVLPGAGAAINPVTGKRADLVLSPDVGLIEDVQNLKGFNTGTIYDGMTQEEINAERTKRANKYGLYMKTTYADARTESRWMSRQLVDAMNGAFQDRDVSEYFREIFMEEIDRLDDEQYVRRTLFNGDQSVDLTSDEAQKTLNDYRDSLFYRYRSGERLLPEGVSGFAMAAPYYVNLLNNLARATGKELTPEQLAAEISNNDVIDFKSFDKTMGIIRYPTTTEGVISATNVAKGSSQKAAAVRKMAEQLKMDQNALYFAPGSPLLQLLQTEDFDGDLNALFRIDPSMDEDKRKKFASIRDKLFSLSKADMDKIWQLSGRTEERQKALDESRKSAMQFEEGKTFDPFSAADQAWALVMGAMGSAKMGYADAAARYARQYNMSRDTAQAILDSSGHYDAVSVWKKAFETYAESRQEQDVVNGGAPFTRIAEWARKALTSVADGADIQQYWTDASQAEFNKQKVDSTNLPSRNDGAAISTLETLFMLRQSGKLDQGELDWDHIFSNLPEIQNPNSVTGRMTKRLREVRADLENGKYLVIGQSLQDELTQYARASYVELQEQVAKEVAAGQLTKKQAANEVDRRFKAAGGLAIQNIDRFGITEAWMKENREVEGHLQGIQDQFPMASIIGQGQEINFDDVDAARQEDAKQQLDQTKQQANETAAKIKKNAARRKANADKAKEIKQVDLQAVVDEAYNALVEGTDLITVAPEDMANWIKTNKGISLSADEVDQIFSGNQNVANAEASLKQVGNVGNSNAEFARLLAAGIAQSNAAEQQFAPLLSAINEFRGNLWSNVYRQENALSGESQADIYRKINENKVKRLTTDLAAFKKTEAYQSLDPSLKKFIDDNLGDENNITEDTLRGLIRRDYADIGVINSQKILESLRTETKRVDPYQEKLDQYDKRIGDLRKQAAQITEDIADPKIDKKLRDRLQANLDQINKDLPQIEEERDNAAAYLGERKSFQQDQFDRRYNQIRRNAFSSNRNFGVRALNYKDSLISQFRSEQLQIEDELNHETDPKRIERLQKQADSTENILGLLNGKIGTSIALGVQFGNMLDGIFSRLGRRAFQQAVQEIRKFIQEFDAAMIEIQAITLKSNEEMEPIRSQTISRALNLKTSVSNVATTEAALYRQGLSDAEVASRTESVVKFATVAKLRVEDATKIITTALQNNLVGSAEEAMDALVALGDSAATTAAEIGKGMQKAAASAKVAGVSYAELTALLTIGTSNTQLGGTQIGTALNTVFSRMRRLTVDKYTADVNGERTTANDAESALKTIGVDLWENGDASSGQMRSSFDILRDISEVWSNISDAQKSIVVTALAGTRMMNVFSTLMEGMDPETLDKYLGLAEDSGGITQTKYEIAMESLNAAINEVKSSFDAVVESFTNNKFITDVLDGFAWVLQRIAELGNSGDSFTIIAAGIGGIAAACLALSSSLAPLNAFAGIIGVITGVLGLGVGRWVLGDGKTDAERNMEKYTKDVQEKRQYSTTVRNKQNSIQKAIDDVREAGKAVTDFSDEADTSKLVQSLENLADAFPSVSDAVNETIKDLSNWQKHVDEIQKQLDDLKKKNIDLAIYNSTTAFEEQYKQIYQNKLSQRTEAEKALLYRDDSSVAFGGSISGAMSAIMNGIDDQQYTRIVIEALLGAYKRADTNDAVRKTIDDYFGAYAGLTGDDGIFNTALEYTDISEESRKELEKLVVSFVRYIHTPIKDISTEMLNLITSVDLPYETFANGTYSSDILKRSMLGYTEKNVNQFIDKDGRLIGGTDGVLKIFRSILNSWRDPNAMEDFIEQYAPDDVFAAFLDVPLENLPGERTIGGGPLINGPRSSKRLRFFNQEEAEKAAKKYGLNRTDIQDESGNAIYQSASQIIDAAVIKQKEQFTQQQQMMDLLDILSDEENAMTSFEDVEDKFTSAALGNVIGNNLALKEYFDNGDVAGFTNYLKGFFLSNGAVSENINRAKELINAESTRAEFAYGLNPEQQAVREAFKSFYGELADTVLDMIIEELDYTQYKDIVEGMAEIDRAYASKEARARLAGFRENPTFENNRLGYNYFTQRAELFSPSMSDEQLNAWALSAAETTGFNLDDFLKENSLFHHMFNLSRQENSGVTREDALSVLTQGMYGGTKTTDYYSMISDILFGAYTQNGVFNNVGTPENIEGLLASYRSIKSGNQGIEQYAMLDEYLNRYSELANILTRLDSGELTLEGASQAFADFNEQVNKDKADDIVLYTKATAGLSENIAKLKKGGSDAVVGIMSMTKAFQKYQDQATAADKARGKSGAELGSMEKQFIAEYLQWDEKQVEQLSADKLAPVLDAIANDARDAIQADMQGTLDSVLSGLEIPISMDQLSFNPDGTVNLDSIYAALDDAGRAVLQAAVEAAGPYADVDYIAEDKGNGVHIKAIATLLKNGKYNTSSKGGGGGGKSAVDKLLEKQQRSGKINEHEIKMLQYRESFYQADSQLGNYGNVLDEEQNARERYAVRLEAQLEELKNEMAGIKKETDDWYKLRDAILSTEEAIEDNTNAMEENRRKIEENRQAILKLHTDLEDMIKQEIETRLDEQRQLLEGASSMEQTIVDTIRHRYQEEWDLIKKDIDKKKEALEEEKRLIDERLQARKDAEKTANDYETMEEMRAQYARISMDSTRTKDAAALREQIMEKQRENAWRIADEEAEATKESIDDQIEAYDKFVSDGDEALDEFLENAHNFADEVAQVLAMSQEELINWLSENDEEYKNSLENTQQTIVKGWEDTFKQMHGIVDLYWDQINAILSSKESFMEYMRQSSSYQNASEDMRKQMEYNWEQMYDNWFKAQDTSQHDTHRVEDFEATGSSSNTSGSSGTNKPSKSEPTSVDKDIAAREKQIAAAYAAEYGEQEYNGSVIPNKTDRIHALAMSELETWQKYLLGYDEGGLVPFTGLAMVHGTPSRPESFLDAEDTVLVRRLLDAFSYISLPTISRYDSSSNASSNSIGDVYVTINEAELKDDADFEEVAERVGELFAKNLEKQGFSTVNYNL